MGKPRDGVSNPLKMFFGYSAGLNLNENARSNLSLSLALNLGVLFTPYQPPSLFAFCLVICRRSRTTRTQQNSFLSFFLNSKHPGGRGGALGGAQKPNARREEGPPSSEAVPTPLTNTKGIQHTKTRDTTKQNAANNPTSPAVATTLA